MNTLTFSDLGEICFPRDRISELKRLNSWCAVPFETAAVKGTMLTALQDSRPQDVSFDPKLKGRYKIYVGLPQYYGNRIRMKLGEDDEWMSLSPASEAGYSGHVIEECFWREADMTDRTVIIGKHKAGEACDAMLAWVRFEACEAVPERPERRIYATDDMHNRLCVHCPDGIREWREIVKNYEDSDVEWLSLENIFIFDGDCSTGSPDTFAFGRKCDEYVQRRKPIEYTDAMLKDLIAYGKQQGLKMCMSMRMGAWGLEFPYDQMYFVNQFKDAHPEFRCVDRDGSPIDALSYAYPEVRAYIIEQFRLMASLGCDAVEMMANRGVPYVLFEEPVVEMFKKRYGFNPKVLPLDDTRLNDLHCEIMTSFVRELRRAVDKKVALHLRTHFSVEDSKRVAIDVEQLAKEKLITTVISYPQRIREKLDGDVFDAETGTIDLSKYARYVRESATLPILRVGDFEFKAPYTDRYGRIVGPITQEERVAAFERLKKACGIAVYYEIMPRFLTPEEYVRRAQSLYDAGADGISLWDTYMRVPQKSVWSTIRRLGHKKDLRLAEPAVFHRLLKVGDKDVSRYIPAWGG